MNSTPKTFGQRSGHKAATWGGVAALIAAWVAGQFEVTDPQDIAAITAAVGYLGALLRTYLEQRRNPSIAVPKGSSEP